MTLEERLAKLEAIVELLMDDATIKHKIEIARLQSGRNKNPLLFEIKPNYQ